MSMLKTLAKVAVGVLVAKTVAGAIKGAGGGGGGTSIPRSRTGSGGGLGDMMDGILGGGSGTAKRTGGGSGGRFDDELGPWGGGGGTGGGLGDVLDNLGGGGTGGRGLDDVIGGLGKGGGGLGDLLESVLGGAAGGVAAGGAARRGTIEASRDAAMRQGGSFRKKVNDALAREASGGAGDEIAGSREEEMAAALLIRAMIQAAKSDGRIDAKEKETILGKLGDASPGEIDFVKQELAAPIDIESLARQTPRELAAQVYGVSVMAITLDERKEAQYLHTLAQALGVGQAQANAIHEKLGAPVLYS
jgi:uncharacterized membrane protein YebE (DUF533 family)